MSSAEHKHDQHDDPNLKKGTALKLKGALLLTSSPRTPCASDDRVALESPGTGARRVSKRYRLVACGIRPNIQVPGRVDALYCP